jgi:hypothetical protein
MSLNPEWGPKIIKTICRHFNDAEGIYMFLPGRRDKRKEEWFEIRFIGPSFKEPSKGVWDIYVTVALLLQNSTQDSNGVNLPFRNSELAGKLAALFTCIPVEDVGILELVGEVDIGPTQDIKDQPHQRVSIAGTYVTQVIL